MDFCTGVYSGVTSRIPFIGVRNREVRIPLSPPVFIGNSEDDSRIDSRNSIPSCPDLTRIVKAWAKLPAPLKAAILAIVNSTEGQL